MYINKKRWTNSVSLALPAGRGTRGFQKWNILQPYQKPFRALIAEGVEAGHNNMLVRSGDANKYKNKGCGWDRGVCNIWERDSINLSNLAIVFQAITACDTQQI